MSDDSLDRARARFDLGDNAIVEAGAGTGKTTLLTDRILYTLLAGGPEGAGVPIERLVALTFTNKAAGEIKQRLSCRLSDLLAHGTLSDPKRKAEAEERLRHARERFARSEEQVLAAARSAIGGMDRAIIGTIHHFAARILKRYPMEAGVDPGFQVDMGEGFADLFATEWSLWLAQELGEFAPRQGAWLEVLRQASLADLEGLAGDLCQDRVRLESLGPSAEMKAEALRIVRAFAPLTRITTDPKRGKIREHLRELSPRLDGISRALEEPLPIPAGREPLVSKAKAWPAAWAELPGREDYERCCELALATSGLQESLVGKAMELVLPFVRRFRDLYRRRGLVSNDGLILGVWGLVLKNRAVREELKSAYDVLLIDEFQDTDPIQGETILLLAEKKGFFADSWREVLCEPGKLFIVGDPKQSIYRFRGADMRAYDGFKDLLIRQGARVCRLRRSFRSREGMTVSVNAIFSRLMSGQAGLQPEYADLTPGASGAPVEEEGANLVLFHEDGGGGGLKAGDSRRAEAAWIADWIASRRGGGLLYKDTALLLRRTSSLEIYLQALKDRGIPYAVEADKYFYGVQEVLDFTNLLRVLDDPGDRAAVVGLMRSPLLGLSDQEIYGLALAQGLSLDGSSLPAAGLSRRSRESLSDFGRMTTRLRSLAGREPLDEFVSRVLGETFLLELCAAAYHHEQTAANLGKYRRLARLANESRGATLKEFIGSVLRSMGEAAPREGESPLADEQFDAVRVLSIHKAKGLEYGTVFLADMGGRRSRGGAAKETCRVDWGAGRAGFRLNDAKATDLAMAFIERDDDERDEAEALRLLYVGMTRAKDRLFLLGSAAPGTSASFSEFLSRVGAWPEKVESGDGRRSQPPCDFKPPEELGLGVRLYDVSELRVPSRGEIVRSNPGAFALDGPVFAEGWRARFNQDRRLAASRVWISPTMFLKEPEKSVLGEESDLGPPALRRRRPGQPRREAALLGELCHRVLEWWDFARPGGWESVFEVSMAALSRRHPLAPWGTLESEARGILENFRSSQAARDLARCEILGREIPFLFPSEGKVVRGSIDLLCRRDGRLWVVDYKSGSDPPAGHARYRRQGEIYVEAVRRSRGEEAGFWIVDVRRGVIEEIPLDSERDWA